MLGGRITNHDEEEVEEELERLAKEVNGPQEITPEPLPVVPGHEPTTSEVEPVVSEEPQRERTALPA